MIIKICLINHISQIIHAYLIFSIFDRILLHLNGKRYRERSGDKGQSFSFNRRLVNYPVYFIHSLSKPGDVIILVIQKVHPSKQIKL